MRALYWAGLGLGMVACSSVDSQVRTRAARDFGCSEQATRIVDKAVGVYRIEGCGFAASYQCSDGAGGITTDCRQLYLSKAAETEGGEKPAQGSEGGEKPAQGSDLAKSP